MSTVGYGDSLSYVARTAADPILQNDALPSADGGLIAATYPGSSPVAGTRISYDENLRDYLNLYSHSIFAAHADAANTKATAAETDTAPHNDNVVVHDAPGNAANDPRLAVDSLPNLRAAWQSVGFGTVHNPLTTAPDVANEPAPPATTAANQKGKPPTVPSELVKQFNALVNTQQSSTMYAAYLSDLKAQAQPAADAAGNIEQ